MKTAMTKLVTLIFFLFWIAAVPAQLVQAADQCTATKGLLEIPIIVQTNDWCWVASANVFTDRFGYKNKSSQPYQPCELYNIAINNRPNNVQNKITIDCCTSPNQYPQCFQPGWPWEVFDPLSPAILWNGNYDALTWDEIKAQICPGGKPGTPFIFIDENLSSGIIHTNVIKGFTEVLDLISIQTLYVDTHYALGLNEVGPKHIEYDSGYVAPVTSKGYKRKADIRDIKQLVTDKTPPVPPVNLRVQ